MQHPRQRGFLACRGLALPGLFALEDRSLVRKRATPSASEAAPGVRLDGLRILAVDDHFDALAVIEPVLTRAGAGVRTALGADAAFPAFARGSDRERAIKAGFNEHLAKPVDPGVLLQKVASVTARM